MFIWGFLDCLAMCLNCCRFHWSYHYARSTGPQCKIKYWRFIFDLPLLVQKHLGSKTTNKPPARQHLSTHHATKNHLSFFLWTLFPPNPAQWPTSATEASKKKTSESPSSPRSSQTRRRWRSRFGESPALRSECQKLACRKAVLGRRKNSQVIDTPRVQM